MNRKMNLFLALKYILRSDRADKRTNLMFAFYGSHADWLRLAVQWAEALSMKWHNYSVTSTEGDSVRTARKAEAYQFLADYLKDGGGLYINRAKLEQHGVK